MRMQKNVEIGLVVAGLTLGWAGLSHGQEKPPKAPPDSGDARPDRGPADGQRPQFEPGRMLERLHDQMERLNLSDEQKTRIKSIVDDAKKEVAEAIKDSKDVEPRERAEKIREAIAPFREKLMDVLDETQREKLRENMKAAGGPGFGRPGAPGQDGAPRLRDGQRDRERPGDKDGKDADGRRRERDRRGPDRPGEQDRPEGRGGDRPGGPGPMIEQLRNSIQKLDLNAEQRAKVDALFTETERKMVDLRSEAEKQAIETRGKFRAAMDENRKQLESILNDEQKARLKDMTSQRGPRDGERGRRPRPDGNRPDGGAPGNPPSPKA